MLTKLNHLFICNLYYAFQDQHLLYTVMDLARGGDLRYRLNTKLKETSKKRKTEFFIPEVELKFYFRCVVLALAVSHVAFVNPLILGSLVSSRAEHFASRHQA